MNDESSNRHRKVYAKGYFDGLRAAGVEMEREGMNESKFQAIYRELSSTAKKVYEAVPIGRPWSAAQIHGELMRNKCSIGMEMTAGCLNSLLNSKVIAEPRKGEFVRVAVRQKQPAETTLTTAFYKAQEKKADMKPEQKTKDPLDKLSELSAALKSVAKSLDDAAIEIAEQMSMTDAETAKLKQLQQLLKSIGQ